MRSACQSCLLRTSRPTRCPFGDRLASSSAVPRSESLPGGTLLFCLHMSDKSAFGMRRSCRSQMIAVNVAFRRQKARIADVAADKRYRAGRDHREQWNRRSSFPGTWRARGLLAESSFVNMRGNPFPMIDGSDRGVSAEQERGHVREIHLRLIPV